MLAVVKGRTTVGLQVVLYAWATVACSLLLIPIAGMGVLFAVVARSLRVPGSCSSRTGFTRQRSGPARSSC